MHIIAQDAVVVAKVHQIVTENKSLQRSRHFFTIASLGPNLQNFVK